MHELKLVIHAHHLPANDLNGVHGQYDNNSNFCTTAVVSLHSSHDSRNRIVRRHMLVIIPFLAVYELKLKRVTHAHHFLVNTLNGVPGQYET